ncbi:hypothetical protein MIND_00966500 [Mycena indigotica]|uniref:GATA-type domain-containing protein n=1 Tax=Mycena indigotica TaxID=2126181 RepID=A0A8H6VXC7_9AGAR|nr:uncharacterized protein MIND_00966500 [Mycena indigotica]KAF7297332.1 hypothetical protein MIND_00966500 [Mycena indigotica]
MATSTVPPVSLVELNKPASTHEKNVEKDELVDEDNNEDKATNKQEKEQTVKEKGAEQMSHRANFDGQQAQQASSPAPPAATATPPPAPPPHQHYPYPPGPYLYPPSPFGPPYGHPHPHDDRNPPPPPGHYDPAHGYAPMPYPLPGGVQSYMPYPIQLMGHQPHAQPPPAPVLDPANYSYTDDAGTKLSDKIRRKCFNCCTTETSTWRRSNLNAGKVLCNKCGLFERTHNRSRPEAFPHKRAPITGATSRLQPYPPSNPRPAASASESAPLSTPAHPNSSTPAAEQPVPVTTQSYQPPVVPTAPPIYQVPPPLPGPHSAAAEQGQQAEVGGPVYLPSITALVSQHSTPNGQAKTGEDTPKKARGRPKGSPNKDKKATPPKVVYREDPVDSPEERVDGDDGEWNGRD